MKLENILINVDRFCDYTPVISTATNLVHLFLKIVIFPRLSNAYFTNNYYYTYLNQKSFDRCALLLIPFVGNFLIGVGDYVVNDHFKKEKNEMLDIIQRPEGYLKFYQASEQIKKDKEVALAAVRQHGYTLECVGKELQKDKEVVSVAVQQEGRALQYANKELRKDKVVALLAVQQNGLAFGCVDKELRKDKELALFAVQQNGQALQYADKELKKNEEVVLAAVQQDGHALQHADEKFRKDKDFMIKVVSEHGWLLDLYASDELKGDQNLIQIRDEMAS